MLKTQVIQPLQYKNVHFGNKISYSPNKLNASLGKDIFKSSQVIPFTGFSSVRLKQAQNYINWVNEKEDGNLRSLRQLDPKRLEGITDGIKVFENMSVKDLYLLENLDGILLKRGCSNACSHCYVQAKMPGQTSIKWENLLDFAEGVGELHNRLGFEPFLRVRVNTFVDSDPISVKSIDKDGNAHNYAEAIDVFYDKTGLPTGIITAGWDEGDEWCQKAGEDLSELVKQNSEVLSSLMVSLNPFHKDMMASIVKGKRIDEALGQLDNTTDPGKRALLTEKINKYTVDAAKSREKYIKRISNTLFTLTPVFKVLKEDDPETDRTFISVLGGGKSGYSKKETAQLLQDVLDRYNSLCKEHGQEPFNFEGNINISKPFELGRSLRAGDPKRINAVALEVDKDNKKSLVTNGFSSRNFYKRDVAHTILKTVILDDNFLDKVVINVDPSSELFMNADDTVDKDKARDDYIRILANTIALNLPLLSEGKAEIRLCRNKDKNVNKEDLNQLLMDACSFMETCLEDEKYATINLNIRKGFRHRYLESLEVFNKNLSELVTYKDVSQAPKKQDEQKSVPLGMGLANVFNQLDPKGVNEFVRRDLEHKMVNIDGQVVVRVDDTGPFTNHFVTLDSVRFNFEDPNTYRYDDLKTIPVDSSKIEASKEVLERDKEYDEYLASKQAKSSEVSFKARLNIVA